MSPQHWTDYYFETQSHQIVTGQRLCEPGDVHEMMLVERTSTMCFWLRADAQQQTLKRIACDKDTFPAAQMFI